MSYTALYRAFRPKKFEEIFGQDHIVKTLKNQIINNRVGHAYLFNGGRGTGKTTAAKILARAVNCLNPQNGEPCNECEMCLGALNGTLTDFVEMDAASNNGIEDIRQIRDTVNFLPAVAKYRVYIIDEVHMLSTGAFNGLLKTLEEPPAHVKFILATTEPQKLPATILSRCQRFDFKKIDDEYIIKRLKQIAKESNIEASEEALRLIAVLAEGGMRDAISILERCIQDGDTNITEEKIRELLGIPEMELINELVENLINYDTVNSILSSEKIIAQGKDITNVIWEIIKYVKDILVYKSTGSIDVYSEKNKERLKNISKNTSINYLIKLINELSMLQNNIKTVTQKNILFETEIIKLSTKNEQIVDNFNERKEIAVDNSKNAIKSNVDSSKSVENTLNVDKKSYTKITSEGVVEKNINFVENENRNSEVINFEKKVLNENNNEDMMKITAKGLNGWQNLVNDLKNNGKMMLYTNLINTTAVEINDLTVGIKFKNGITPFGKTVLEKPENIQYLTTEVSKMCGKTVRLKFVEKENNNVKNDGESMPFNIID